MAQTVAQAQAVLWSRQVTKQSDKPDGKGRDFKSLTNWIFGALGFCILGYLVVRSGPARLWDQLSHLGPGFLLAVGAFAASKFFMALAWRPLFQPGRSTASLWDLTAATMVGGAINDVTPGGVGGEPLKVTWLAGKAPGEDLVSSLLLHNYLYVLTNILLMLAGGIALVSLLDLSTLARVGVFGGMAVMVGAAVGLAFVLRKGVAAPFVRLVRKLGLKSIDPEALLARARETDDQARRFFSERPLEMVQAFGWMVVSRAVAALETYFLLRMLGWSVSPVDVLLITTMTVAVYLVFPFVPSQVGAMEGAAFLLYPALGIAGAAGLAVEVVRRLRVIVMLAIALAIMAAKALSERLASGRGEEPHRVPAQEGESGPGQRAENLVRSALSVEAERRRTVASGMR